MSGPSRVVGVRRPAAAPVPRPRRCRLPNPYGFMSAASGSKRPWLSNVALANAIAWQVVSPIRIADASRPVRPPSGSSRPRRHAHDPDTGRRDP